MNRARRKEESTAGPNTHAPTDAGLPTARVPWQFDIRAPPPPPLSFGCCRRQRGVGRFPLPRHQRVRGRRHRRSGSSTRTPSRGVVHMRLRRRPATTRAPLGAAPSSRVVLLPWKDESRGDNGAGAKRAVRLIGATRETPPPRGSRSPSRRSRGLVSWRSADRAPGAGCSWAKRGDPYKDSATLIAAAAAAGARGAAAPSGSCAAAVPPLRRTAARGAAAAAAGSPFFARGSSPSPPPREDNPAGAAGAFFRRSEEDGFASIIPSSSSARSQRRSPQRASVRTSSIPPCAHLEPPSRSGRCPLLAVPSM